MRGTEEVPSLGDLGGCACEGRWWERGLEQTKGVDVHVHVHKCVQPEQHSHMQASCCALQLTDHLIHVHVHVIVVSRFLQHEGSTSPCTVKTMRQLTCTDRPYT